MRYISHIDENGYLPIERDLNDGYTVSSTIEYCNDLKEILKSNKATVNFNKFLRKIIEFEGYESGTYDIVFNKISKNKNGEYAYDSLQIIYVVPDSIIYGDGIVFRNVEDEPFENLPYCPENYEDEDFGEVLFNWIDKQPEVKRDELIKGIHNVMNNVIKYSELDYIIDKHK